MAYGFLGYVLVLLRRCTRMYVQQYCTVNSLRSNKFHQFIISLLQVIRDIRMYIPPHSSPGGVPFPRVRTGTAAAVYSYIRKADCYYFVSAMETLIVVARQTPVPLICIVCWALACTVPGTRYMLHLEREARDWSTRYIQRVLVSYNNTTAAAVHVL